MNDETGSNAGTAQPPGGSGTPGLPDLADVANAFRELTAFLRNGQATADQKPFTEPQLGIEDDFRALLGGLGRREPVTPPGRFYWLRLVKGRLELEKALPVEVTEVGGYAADRRRLWRVAVPATATDRRVLEHHAITPDGVERLQAFNARGVRVLVGFRAAAEAPSTSPRT